MYLGLRVLTTAAWAVAITLLVVASMATNPRLAMALFMWCIFVSGVAMVGAFWVILEHVLSHESDRNANKTADAVAVAIMRLESEGRLRSVTRQGT